MRGVGWREGSVWFGEAGLGWVGLDGRLAGKRGGPGAGAREIGEMWGGMAGEIGLSHQGWVVEAQPSQSPLFSDIRLYTSRLISGDGCCNGR